MEKKIGFETDMDQAVIDFLETHHIRGKDVYAWSAAGQDGDIGTMTISFFVSGVDRMDARPNIVVEDMTAGGQQDVPIAGREDLAADVTASILLPNADWRNRWPWREYTAVPDDPHTPLVTSDPDAVTEKMTKASFYNPDGVQPYVRKIRDNPQA